MAAMSPGYSADVRLSLVVGDRSFDVGQVGPEDLVLREPVTLPPCEGEIVITIDGSERRYPVSLIDGVKETRTLVRYVDLPTVANVSAAGAT
jgi:hypothetical protein